MGNSVQIGDRLIIINNDYNPLTDFYLEKIEGEICYVNFSYGIIGGKSTFPKWQVSKHPIQNSERVLSTFFHITCLNVLYY